MSLDKKCPRCGSMNVQLSNTKSKHGCLWFILLGWIYLIWVFIKWCIGLMIFIYWDWWMAIIKKISGKGYVWKCKRWFSFRERTYFCHNCAHNFRE